MTELERLLLAQYFYNATKDMVKTKDPYNLRGQIDAEYRQIWERTGARTYALFFDGEEVGTYSIKRTKETSEKHDYSLIVDDYVDLAKWFDNTITDDECRHFCALHLGKFAQHYMQETGAEVDGCHVEVTITPASSGGDYDGGVLKIDKTKMREKLAGYLTPAIAGFLEGDNENRADGKTNEDYSETG